MWFGPKPRVIITDPEQIKDVLNKIFDFPRTNSNPFFKLLAGGLVTYEGEKWAKHRKIINPAFHVEKLKVALLYLIGYFSSKMTCDIFLELVKIPLLTMKKLQSY